MADTNFWVSLALLPGLDPAICKRLHQRLAALPPERWAGALAAEPEISPAIRESVGAVVSGELPDTVRRVQQRCLAWATQPDCRLLTFADAAYPPLLYEIADPPPLLFVQGRPAALKLPQIAIVGSRRPTADGLRHARSFAMALCRAGYQICSGLALGIDTASHQGALEAGGTTLAVLGTGIDRIYPRTNLVLARKLAETGALISEFPPGTEGYPSNFPQRNRIISGLAHGVLVIEAAEQSGSLITARLAADQGREVFALPGSINNPMARGCHRLIRQGVKLVEKVEDLLEELPALLQWEQARLVEADATPGAVAASALDSHDKALLAHIAYDPVTVDALALRTSLAAADVQARLTLLELQGLIRLQTGGYVRTAA